MTEPSAIVIDLVGCARCEGDGHPGLVFSPLAHPVEIEGSYAGAEISLTHWATCPVNGEPILMRVVDETESAPR